jgi:hypothetical protein
VAGLESEGCEEACESIWDSRSLDAIVTNFLRTTDCLPLHQLPQRFLLGHHEHAVKYQMLRKTGTNEHTMGSRHKRERQYGGRTQQVREDQETIKGLELVASINGIEGGPQGLGHDPLCHGTVSSGMKLFKRIIRCLSSTSLAI